jgi:streptogramin lyase
LSDIYTFHCPNCGGPLDYTVSEGSTIRCHFCDSSILIPETLQRNLNGGEATSIRDTPEQAYTAQRIILDLSHDQSTNTFTQNRTKRWIGCIAALVVIVAVLSIIIPILIALPIFSLTRQAISVAQQIDDSPTTSIPLPSATPSYSSPVLSFGGRGIGPGQFEDARLVTVDGEGNIYIGEYNNGRIQRFNPDGQYQSEWRIEGEGNLYNIAASFDGTIYAAFNGNIERYNGKNGQYLGMLDYPQDHFFEDVFVTSQGDLYAISDGEDILRFSSDGRIKLIIPEAISTQTGRAELDSSLAADGFGNIYVLARFNEGIFKFSPDGRYIDRFGKGGDEPGQIFSPYGIAVDGQARIFISDGSYVQVFSGEDGQFIDRFSVEGGTYRLTVDSSQALYVVTVTPSVLKYRLPPP